MNNNKAYREKLENLKASGFQTEAWEEREAKIKNLPSDKQSEARMASFMLMLKEQG